MDQRTETEMIIVSFLTDQIHLLYRLLSIGLMSSHIGKRILTAVLRSSSFCVGVSCDVCLKTNFSDRRYKCLICDNYDLCGSCYDILAESQAHSSHHPMQCILTKTAYGHQEQLVSLPHNAAFLFRTFLCRRKHRPPFDRFIDVSTLQSIRFPSAHVAVALHRRTFVVDQFGRSDHETTRCM